MKPLSRILVFTLILNLLVVCPVLAQEKQSQDTDLIRAKIEQFEKIDLSSKSASVQLIYKRTLLRLYDQLSAALQKDIRDLKAMQSAVGSANTDSQKEIALELQKLVQEQSETAEKFQTLNDELKGGASTDTAKAQTPPATSDLPLSDAVYRPRTTTPQPDASVTFSRNTTAIPTSDSLAPQPQITLPPPAIDTPLKEGNVVKGKSDYPDADVEVLVNNKTVGVDPASQTKVYADKTFEIDLVTPLKKDDKVRVRQGSSGHFGPYSSPVTVLNAAAADKANQETKEASTPYSKSEECLKLFPDYKEGKSGRRRINDDSTRMLKCTPSGLTGLLVGGVVVSQQEKNFSQSDPFFGFTAGYNTNSFPSGWVLHYRIQGIFQSQPQTAVAPKAATASASPSPTPTPTPTPTPAASPSPVDISNFTPFLASRKTFDIDFHIWADRPFGRGVLRIGPYFGIGASTFIDSNELKGDETVTKTDASGGETKLDPSLGRASNDLKKFIEGGIIANLLKDNGELFMQTQMLYGQYEALAGLVPGHDTRNRFIGRLRIFPTGLNLSLVDPNKESSGVSMSPMFGVELNAGRGPDQLKFFTGIAVSIRKFKPFAKEETPPATTTTPGTTTPAKSGTGSGSTFQ
jgi:hypothetical protein